jgi:hypothetical protein
MGSTKEALSCQIREYDSLRVKIEKINKEADDAMKGFDFYSAKSKPKDLGLIFEDTAQEEEEDSVAIKVGEGSKYKQS